MFIKKEFIPLGKGIDGTVRRIPFFAAKSEKEGPTVWLTAAIHGDEVTGTALIQTIFKWLEKTPLLKGQLFGIPILNVMGFETISRHDPIAAEDLNRNFPGDEHGSIPERLAAMIFHTIVETKPDYVIDFHTDSVNSIAYTLVDYPAELKKNKILQEMLALASALEFPYAIDTEKNTGYSLGKCLTGALVLRGIPAVTVELGGPLVVMENFRQAGAESVWRFLTSLEMLKGTAKPLSITIPDEMFYIEARVCTQSTGIIEYRVKPGQRITKGKILGKVRNVFGETIEVIKSPFDGLLFSHEDQSVTFPGQALFTFGVVQKFSEIEKIAALAHY